MSSIKVNVDSLIEKISLIQEDNFSTVQLDLHEEEYEQESTLKIYAVDSINDRLIDYGSIEFDSGEL